MIFCSDTRIYTGITTDINRRWHEHSEGVTGAKFFRGRKPQAVIFLEPWENRSAASKREYQIKQLSRKAKMDLSRNHQKQTLSWLSIQAPGIVADYHMRSSGIS
ncbi:MAG: GIY-YIG nuclease family protein [Hahellaceae bacterium]|nr:GIY-YIG nuclease family protein [Hahellaceae bacterium]MCP5209599.1 GIY-YIG nuclease family protein [Hahellaceae bacterium]